MCLAFAANVFGDMYEIPVHPQHYVARRANEDDMKVIGNWAELLKDITKKQLTEDRQENVSRLHVYAPTMNLQPSIQLSNDIKENTKAKPNSQNVATNGCQPVLDSLNDDQRKAHEIVEKRLFGGKNM
jgi:hypothetical protein